ncbi:DUF4190 domain-containing protein [Kribbella sp. NPDC055071]
MDQTPPTDGGTGTPPPVIPAPPGQPPYPGQPYQGQPGQGQPGSGQPGSGQPGSGQPYQGPPGQPPYGGMPPMQGMPPVQGMPSRPGPWQPRQTSAPAILSFVLSILGTTVISLVLGIVALNRIPSRNQKGKGFAIAGIVISCLWLVLIGLVVALGGDGSPDRNAAGQVTATQTTRPSQLRVGDCVSEIKEGDVRDIKVQPCDQPNGGRVFAVFELPAGEWPGLTAVQTAAEKGCTDRWKASKQQADEPSSIIYVHPTESGWSLGDRGTTCLLTPN